MQHSFCLPKSVAGSDSRISSRGASARVRKTLAAAPNAETRQLVWVLTDLVRIVRAVLCSGVRSVKPTKISTGRIAPTYLTWKQQSEARVPSKGSRHTDRQRLRQRQASFLFGPQPCLDPQFFGDCFLLQTVASRSWSLQHFVLCPPCARLQMSEIRHAAFFETALPMRGCLCLSRTCSSLDFRPTTAHAAMPKSDRTTLAVLIVPPRWREAQRASELSTCSPTRHLACMTGPPALQLAEWPDTRAKETHFHAMDFFFPCLMLPHIHLAHRHSAPGRYAGERTGEASHLGATTTSKDDPESRHALRMQAQHIHLSSPASFESAPLLRLDEGPAPSAGLSNMRLVYWPSSATTTYCWPVELPWGRVPLISQA